MTKIFTAKEFFDYLLSFSTIYIWEGGDGNNGVFVRVPSKNLEIIKRKNDFAIWGTVHNEEAGVQQGGFVLTGNVFECKILENGRRANIEVRSDCASRAMNLEAVNIRM